jgi:TolB-like protein
MFTELKRRKVFRVAVTYIVLGWVLIQVADTIAPMMNLPEAAPRFVLFLLIILFPVSIFLAWAFELRPTDGEPIAMSKAGRGALSVLGIVVLIGFVAWQFIWGGNEPSESDVKPPKIANTTMSPTRQSLAVLPFADLSAQGDQEYFGDGIAEELLNVLASIEEISIASRTSAFAFKGKDRNIREIANLLNVSYVLEGSVRKASEQVRITAQLIDASTDRHIWSDTFDRELTTNNLFAIQDEIAESIVAALNAELDLNIETEIEIEKVTDDLDAYDLFLEAQRLEYVASLENNHKQVQLLERAVALDPDFAEAWGFLALRMTHLPTWDHSLDAEVYHRRAIDLAQHALTLDPVNENAYYGLVSSHFYMQDWEAYRTTSRAALEAIPDRPEYDPADLMGLGYLKQAYDVARTISNDSPSDGFYNQIQALYFLHTRQFERAIDKFEDAILNGYVGAVELSIANAYYLETGNSAVMSGVWSATFEAYDRELLILLPHIIELMTAPSDEFDKAAARFRIIAHELGFDEASLVRRGNKFGLRTPLEVAMAYDRYDAITDMYWGNNPMFWMWDPVLQRWRRSESFRQRVRDSGMLAYWQKYGWPDLCRPMGKNDFECD